MSEIRNWILAEGEQTDQPEGKTTAAKRRESTWEFHVEEQSGADLIIRKTRTTPTGKKIDTYMALLPSQNQFYVKDGAKVSVLTEENAKAFFKQNKGGLVFVHDCWIRKLPSSVEEVNRLFQAVTACKVSEVIRDLIKRNLWSPEVNAYYEMDCIDEEIFLMIAKKIQEVTRDSEVFKDALFSVGRHPYGWSAEENEKVALKDKIVFLVSLAQRRRIIMSLGVDKTKCSGRLLLEQYGHGGIHTLVSSLFECSLDLVGVRLTSTYRNAEACFADILRYGGSDVPIKKIADYLAFQPAIQGYSMGEFLEEWRDTLQLQMEIYGEIRDRFPVHLASDHKMLSAKGVILKKARDEKRFEQRYHELQHYEYADKTYCIKVPRSSSDILYERDKQGNCLLGFITPHAEGTTTVLFMRDADAPDVPKITIEVRDGILRQAYRAGNKMPDEKELAFIRKWALEKGIVPIDHWRPLGA